MSRLRRWSFRGTGLCDKGIVVRFSVEETSVFQGF